MSLFIASRSIRLGLAGVLGCLLLLVATSAEAQTTATRGGNLYTVCPSGCDYTTIKAAVAVTVDNDQIFIDVAGTHTEPGASVITTDDIVIFGRNRDQTRLEMAGPARHFVVTAGRLALRSLTIANGFPDSTAVGPSGGAVSVANNATLDVSSVKFEGNGNALGGAIAGTGSTTIEVRDSYFLSNVASGTGGAIYTSGTLIVKASTFELNAALAFPAGKGGAIYVVDGNATVENSTFYNNQAAAGMAIYTSDSVLIMRHNTIEFDALIRTGAAAEATASGTVPTALSASGGSASISNNIISNLGGDACGGDIVLIGLNIASDNTCTGASHGDTDPRFGSFGYYASKVPVLPITANSPARYKASSAANSACDRVATRDQRGATRTHDNNSCDLGAYEYFSVGECSFPSVAIPDNGAPVTETINLATDGYVLDVNIYLEAAHTWVGDLSARVSSQGQSVTLFDRPGVPASDFGCTRDNVSATFSDSNTDFAESMCDIGAAFAINGDFKPVSPLQAFVGLDSDAGWSVSMQDHAAGQVGTLGGTVCVTLEYIPAEFGVATPLAVGMDEADIATASVLWVTAGMLLLLALVTCGVVFCRKPAPHRPLSN